jgi:hypothetical protein
MRIAHFMSLAAILFSSNVTLGEQDSPIAAARFGISIDGVQVSAVNVTGGGAATDKLVADKTPLSITIDRDGSEAVWAWLAASTTQGSIEKKVEAQAKGKRRATFTNAHIMEVKFDDLDSNDNKKPMRLTLTVVPNKIVAASDVAPAASSATQKKWLPSNFKVKLGAVALSRISKVENFAIKVKVTESGKPPVFVIENLRMQMDAADQKLLTDALAKDKTKALSIELTNADGSVWKTITLTGVNAKPSKGTASKSITIKGSKILIN